MKCTLPTIALSNVEAALLVLTFQEVLHLVSHLAGQPVLGQQVEIMHFVFIGNGDLSSARYELHHLRGEQVSGKYEPGRSCT